MTRTNVIDLRLYCSASFGQSPTAGKRVFMPSVAMGCTVILAAGMRDAWHLTEGADPDARCRCIAGYMRAELAFLKG